MNAEQERKLARANEGLAKGYRWGQDVEGADAYIESCRICGTSTVCLDADACGVKPTTVQVGIDEDNNDRADWALSAVKHFSTIVHNDDEPVETQVTDLLADLFHLLRREGLDIDEVVSRARYHFECEVEEEGDYADPDPELSDLEFIAKHAVTPEFFAEIADELEIEVEADPTQFDRYAHKLYEQPELSSSEWQELGAEHDARFAAELQARAENLANTIELEDSAPDFAGLDPDDRCDYCGLKLGACPYNGLRHTPQCSHCGGEVHHPYVVGEWAKATDWFGKPWAGGSIYINVCVTSPTRRHEVLG